MTWFSWSYSYLLRLPVGILTSTSTTAGVSLMIGTPGTPCEPHRTGSVCPACILRWADSPTRRPLLRGRRAVLAQPVKPPAAALLWKRPPPPPLNPPPPVKPPPPKPPVTVVLDDGTGVERLARTTVDPRWSPESTWV